MPLTDGYGVLIGSLHRHYADPAEHFGSYFHANLEVATPRGIYRCLLDVDDRTPAGLLWRVAELGPIERLGAIGAVARLPDGWHDLEPSRRSGALDYIRSPELNPAKSAAYAVVDPRLELIQRDSRDRRCPVWRRGTTRQALDDVERLLVGQDRLLLFGEPFTRGHGIHNVHQNQGDPPGSRWWSENGIWQDGGLLVRRPDGTLAAYLTRFASQAERTDRHGHPV